MFGESDGIVGYSRSITETPSLDKLAWPNWIHCESISNGLGNTGIVVMVEMDGISRFNGIRYRLRRTRFAAHLSNITGSHC